jgi:hypothetical protein
MNCWKNSNNGGAGEIMPPKRLVIDANILVRAVLGSRVRGLIERYCNSTAFYMAETNTREAEFYLSTELAAKRGLNEGLWRPVFEGVLTTSRTRGPLTS